MHTFKKSYPSQVSKEFPIDENHLKQLHVFAEKNPIYLNSFEENISGISCMVYEGDINEYWLNSIKHGSSCQPFYPTWIMSAYVMVSISKKLGYSRTCRYWFWRWTNCILWKYFRIKFT